MRSSLVGRHYLADVPAQSFRHSTTTPAAITEVWKALDRPTTWEAIPGVDRVTDPVFDHAGHLQGFSFESAVGGRNYRGWALPAIREEERLLGWDIGSSELKGRILVGLAPDADGTRVEISLDLEGAGFLGSLLFPAIATAIGREFSNTVEAFVAGLDPQ